MAVPGDAGHRCPVWRDLPVLFDGSSARHAGSSLVIETSDTAVSLTRHAPTAWGTHPNPAAAPPQLVACPGGP